MTRVAVLGTGIMGSAMARNLLRAGLAVTVWDRSPEATAGLAREGARAAGSAAGAVRDADVVITTLPTAAVGVGDVRGPCPRRRSRRERWAQMATIGVEATEQTAARLEKIRPGRCSPMPRCPAARARRAGCGPPSWRPGLAVRERLRGPFAATAEHGLVGAAGQAATEAVVNAYRHAALIEGRQVVELARRLHDVAAPDAPSRAAR
jgi:hypothetical protein